MTVFLGVSPPWRGDHCARGCQVRWWAVYPGWTSERNNCEFCCINASSVCQEQLACFWRSSHVLITANDGSILKDLLVFVLHAIVTMLTHFKGTNFLKAHTCWSKPHLRRLDHLIKLICSNCFSVLFNTASVSYTHLTLPTMAVV